MKTTQHKKSNESITCFDDFQMFSIVLLGTKMGYSTAQIDHAVKHYKQTISPIDAMLLENLMQHSLGFVRHAIATTIKANQIQSQP